MTYWRFREDFERNGRKRDSRGAKVKLIRREVV